MTHDITDIELNSIVARLLRRKRAMKRFADLRADWKQKIVYVISVLKRLGFPVDDVNVGANIIKQYHLDHQMIDALDRYLDEMVARTVQDQSNAVLPSGIRDTTPVNVRRRLPPDDAVRQKRWTALVRDSTGDPEGVMKWRPRDLQTPDFRDIYDEPVEPLESVDEDALALELRDDDDRYQTYQNLLQTLPGAEQHITINQPKQPVDLTPGSPDQPGVQLRDPELGLADEYARQRQIMLDRRNNVFEHRTPNSPYAYGGPRPAGPGPKLGQRKFDDNAVKWMWYMLDAGFDVGERAIGQELASMSTDPGAAYIQKLNDAEYAQLLESSGSETPRMRQLIDTVQQDQGAFGIQPQAPQEEPEEAPPPPQDQAEVVQGFKPGQLLIARNSTGVGRAVPGGRYEVPIKIMQSQRDWRKDKEHINHGSLVAQAYIGQAVIVHNMNAPLDERFGYIVGMLPGPEYVYGSDAVEAMPNAEADAMGNKMPKRLPRMEGIAAVKLQIWLEKSKQIVTAPPNRVEEDREGRAMPSAADTNKKVREERQKRYEEEQESKMELDRMRRNLRKGFIVQSVLNLLAQAAPTPAQMQQQSQTPGNPNTPKTQDGQAAKPGDYVQPAPGQPNSPGSEGTVTSVEPNGALILQNNQGQQVSVPPGNGTTPPPQVIPKVN